MGGHFIPRRVMIVGDGFAGLLAAQERRHRPVEVTVVDRASHHLWQPPPSQCPTAVLSEGLPFCYRDLGSVAYLSRRRVVISASRFHPSGLIGWFAWLGIHIAFLTTFRTRAEAILTWAIAFSHESRQERALTMQQIVADKDVAFGILSANAWMNTPLPAEAVPAHLRPGPGERRSTLVDLIDSTMVLAVRASTQRPYRLGLGG